MGKLILNHLIKSNSPEFGNGLLDCNCLRSDCWWLLICRLWIYPLSFFNLGFACSSSKFTTQTTNTCITWTPCFQFENSANIIHAMSSRTQVEMSLLISFDLSMVWYNHIIYHYTAFPLRCSTYLGITHLVRT